jgi:carboxyl-terminal processing protease
MDALWTQRVKYDLLNLKLANADMTKNKETLKETLRKPAVKLQSNKLANTGCIADCLWMR